MPERTFRNFCAGDTQERSLTFQALLRPAPPAAALAPGLAQLLVLLDGLLLPRRGGGRGGALEVARLPRRSFRLLRGRRRESSSAIVGSAGAAAAPDAPGRPNVPRAAAAPRPPGPDDEVSDNLSLSVDKSDDQNMKTSKLTHNVTFQASSNMDT